MLPVLLLCCAGSAGTGRAASDAILVVPDVLAFPGEQIYLKAYLYRKGHFGLGRSGIPGEILRFFDPTGKPLRSLLTDASGMARARYRAEEPGQYPFRVHLAENPRYDAAPATGTLYVQRKESPLFFVTVEDALMPPRRIPFLSPDLRKTEPRAGAVPGLTEIASCHTIIYLSIQSIPFSQPLRSWLAGKHYPPGPLYCLDSSPLEGVLSPGQGRGTDTIDALWRNRTAPARLVTCSPTLATAAAKEDIEVFLLTAREAPGSSPPDQEQAEEETPKKVRSWEDILEECPCRPRSAGQGSFHRE